MLVFNIKDFIVTGYKFTDLVSKDTLQVLNYLTSNTFQPATQSTSFSAQPAATLLRARSISIENTVLDTWAVDKLALRQAIKKFEKTTTPLRSLLLGPPSTSTIPEQPKPTPASTSILTGASSPQGIPPQILLANLSTHLLSD